MALRVCGECSRSLKLIRTETGQKSIGCGVRVQMMTLFFPSPESAGENNLGREAGLDLQPAPSSSSAPEWSGTHSSHSCCVFPADPGTIERFDVLRHTKQAPLTTKQETELQQAAFTIKHVGWPWSCWRRGINFLCVIYQSLVPLHHGGRRSSGGDDDETNSVNNSMIDKVSPLNRASSSDPAVGGA